MTVDDLRASLRDPEPPPGLGALLTAMWLAGRGDWARVAFPEPVIDEPIDRSRASCRCTRLTDHAWPSVTQTRRSWS